MLIIAGTLSPALAREYRVLAVRVDFPYEDPDHETTSGRGTFDLRDFYASDADSLRESYYHPWDVPPHDRRFFELHLQALNNYWSTVSEGRVTVTGEVWPRDPEGAYTLSRKFYKYGNGRSKEETANKLVDLLAEALEACADVEGSAVDFTAFDTFMVIHAGIGSETSGNLNDIPSAYVDSEDILDYHGNTLSVGGAMIPHGIIVPEKISSTGSGGLNGIMAQMFAHRLGLPSMSNNNIGMPAAGGWSLMDTGSMSWGARTRGFVPTHPCAWSKIDLGWIDPVTITSDTTLDIAATYIDNGLPRAVKIPISGDEYILLENRYRAVSRDSLATATYSDSDSSGVWLSVEQYDAYIPGSGILAWRINETIVDAGRDDNTLNDDSYRRGIDLLEADGRQDIGALVGFGDDRAAYTEGHDDDAYSSTGRAVLSPITTPDSGSIWGADSGIIITALSPPGEVMTVSISFEGTLPGFPLSVPDARIVTTADLDGDGIDELFVSTSDSSAIVYGADGTLHIPAFATFAHPAAGIDPNGGSATYYALTNSGIDTGIGFGQFSPSTRYSFGTDDPLGTTVQPFLSVVGTDDTSVLICAYSTYSGSPKTVIERIDTDMSLTPEARYSSVALPDTVTVTGLASDGNTVIVTTSERIYLVDFISESYDSINPTDDIHSGPVMTDLDRGGTVDYIVPVRGGFDTITSDGIRTQVSLFADPLGSPALADINADGYPEVILCTPRYIHAYTREGVPVTGFPFALPSGMADEVFTSPPVVADLNGDGRLDIAAATSAMRLVAYDPNGIPTPGFPISIHGPVTTSPCVFVRDSDDKLAIAYATNDGVYARDMDVSADSDLRPWAMTAGGADATGYLADTGITMPILTTAPFQAYCYPNPVSGDTCTFRIVPDVSTSCTVQLYTADGHRVYERHLARSEVTPGVANEVRMDAADLASGLYLAVVRTSGHEHIFKVGVLK
jgi:M6 family metalloprotease-like protein